MPQRPKTPPPPQDEIFMTIFYPYPQHANMEIEEDVERVARWLGTIVKPAYFNAFYHKPSARNTIIIEVSKTIGDDERRKLLGQHIWKNILANPTEGEKTRRSGIFYSVYQNIRDVQKEGWKRIDFEDTWFMPRDGRKYTSVYYDQAEWERIVEKDGVFSLPYPLSSRCDVPNEDPTNRGFGRPLPVDLFPIPVRPEMPKEVPGTLKWIQVKSLPESAWAKPPSKAIKGGPGSQGKDKGARTAAPRNNHVGPPISPTSSGVNHQSPGSLPPNLVANDKGKGKQKETGEPSPAMDELIAHAVAMGLDSDEEDQEYYGAGLENVLASAGIATSPALPPPDRDPIDHNGVGVHVSGVTPKPVVVEDSLWGNPLENMNKKLKKEDEVPLCEYHGKVCSKGICKVYEKQKQLLEHQKKLKDTHESKNWRGGNGGQNTNNGRGGRGARGIGRGRGMLLRGGPPPGRDSGPRSPTFENRTPRKPNGATPPKNAWSKPMGSPKVNNGWGADNNSWSPSEMGESAKPVEKADSNPGAEDVNGDNERLWDPPAAPEWSQSEAGGGSQADPWSGPRKSEGKPNGTKNGSTESHNSNSAGPAWGGAGGAKDWTPSELGADDSVSQRGDDGFRNAPSRNPEKKSWADLVDDGDEIEPAPVFSPAPDPEVDSDEDDWVATGKGRGRGRGRGKGKGKGRGKGKARSATGWSDVTNQGFW